MMKGHRTIPVFIPELACPFRCSYCNQGRITGQAEITPPSAVPPLIDEHLRTIDPGKFSIELGFFGGSFTGLKPGKQQAYLETARPYLEDGRISGIRVSTRPDYIDRDVLRLLKSNGVTTIELGAQTMDEYVLQQSRRGHTVDETRQASSMIVNAGFKLGLQMMVGLPGSSAESEIATAHEFVTLGASETRIYPVVVLRETQLEELYRQGKFRPLGLDEAAVRTAHLLEYFSEQGVIVLRTGLHPSDELLSGDSLVAGPFHPAFGSMAKSRLWHRKLLPLTAREGEDLLLSVNPGSLADAAGYRKENRNMLERYFRQVNFRADDSLREFQYHADIC